MQFYKTMLDDKMHSLILFVTPPYSGLRDYSDFFAIDFYFTKRFQVNHCFRTLGKFKYNGGDYSIVRKKKTVVINNPQLMRMRNNFRNILLAAVHIKMQEYLAEEARRKGSRKYAGLQQELRRAENSSICRCPRCRARDKNMTFNPVDKTWYCVQCYLEMQHWTAKKKTGVSNLFPQHAKYLLFLFLH